MLAKEKIWRAWLKGIIGLVAITGIVLLALFALSALGVSTKSPEAMIDGLAQYDVYVPLIIIVLMIISVIVVPIPGSVIAMAAGYMLSLIHI